MHTTANHPWLTADHGWVPAGALRSGEPVVTLYGVATTKVASVRIVSDQADYYNLIVTQDHLYAVDDGGAAVITWRDSHDAMQAADE